MKVVKWIVIAVVAEVALRRGWWWQAGILAIILFLLADVLEENSKS